MPQMAPISWTLLFIYFSTLMITTMIMNFFIFTQKENKKMTKSFINNNWKW